MATIGTDVTINLRPQTSAVDTDAAGTYMVPILANRGPVDTPVLLRSYSGLVDRFDERVAYGYGHDDLHAFFEEAAGAGRAYVVRVAGEDATTGELTLKDRSTSPGIDTVLLEAADPGAWSADLDVVVSDGLETGTVDVTLFYRDVEVETYNVPTVAGLVEAMRASEFVRATDLGSASTGTLALPKNITATPLSAGDDDRGAVSAADMIAAMDLFTEDLGPGAVAIPGQTHSTVYAALAAHAANTGRIVLVNPPFGTSVTVAKSSARALRTTTNAYRTGFLYPWVEIPDETGGTRSIPPTGFVAGLRARSIGIYGPWRAPTSDNGNARFVVGVERTLTRAEINSLDDDAVSVIRVGRAGPQLRNWRSLSSDTSNWRSLAYIDELNDIAWQLEQRLDQYTGETWDGDLRLANRMETTCVGVLRPVSDAGGLYVARDPVTNQVVDPGYRVIVADAAINPPDQLEQGVADVFVAVRLSPNIDWIRVTLAKVPLAAALA
jgi:hypothetical protein